MAVLDFNTNRDALVHDLTDLAAELIAANFKLQHKDDERDEVLKSVLAHNESLIDRLDYWRGKALKVGLAGLGLGLIIGSGLLAHATLDIWQILDRTLSAVGL